MRPERGLIVELVVVVQIKVHHGGGGYRPRPPEIDHAVGAAAQDKLIVVGIVLHPVGPVLVAAPQNLERAAGGR